MKNIYLIGPMGVGKTTVGRFLANLLNFQFYDADLAIEKRTGASISWIFDKEGERGFRVREENMTQYLCQKQSIVLATGGGVVLSKKNRKCLSETGFVVFITADVDILIDRTSKDKTRPLLLDNDPKKVLSNIIKQRQPLYESIADMTIVSGHDSAQNMAKEIYNQLS